LAAAGPARGAVDDEAVRKGIEKAVAYIAKQQKGDGSWGEKKYAHTQQEVGNTELALLTLLYVGEHPNRETVSKALDGVLSRPLDYTYAVSVRLMALAQVQNKLVGAKRDLVRTALRRDAAWLVASQGPSGGWGYTAVSGDRPSRTYVDLSITQMAVLALWEAANAGAEIPRSTWDRVTNLYFGSQRDDGGWTYTPDGKDGSYGSMTAAGLATLFITTDQLDLASGCPCRGGKSARGNEAVDRRIDACLSWLDKNFKVEENPKGGDHRGKRIYYWLYSAERAGSAAGYKYFGGKDWFKLGAEFLLKKQAADGSWDGPYGRLVSTCFAALFLFKGRGPILFNKLEFEGEWNSHRRDIGNLTHYFSKAKEQLCHWQIVNLKKGVEELHDAPVLYITPEAPPAFSDSDKKKLRQFTDGGGTILLEASCGNADVKRWALEFTKEVWPEWALTDIAEDHAVFAEPHKLKARPQLMGMNDGLRTFLFYAPDDVSCFWQTKALVAKGYLFDWGINLIAYATDNAPLRAKLAARTAAAQRFAGKVQGGAANLRVARVRHGGDWRAGANYDSSARLIGRMKDKAGVTLSWSNQGSAPGDLGTADVAYLAAGGDFSLTDAEVKALAAFTSKGGRVWAESVTGSPAFDGAFRRLCAQAGWTLELLPKTHALVTGQMKGAKGYDMSSGVRFRRALRMTRGGRDNLEAYAILSGGKLVGLYSPLDVMFSLTPYEAGGCRGYETDDAAAVATNTLIYLATQGK
jgi:hypothetical protein